MDIQKESKPRGDTYNLNLETDSRAEASHILAAAGLAKTVYVQEDSSKWVPFAGVGAFAAVCVVLAVAVASPQHGLGVWMTVAVKAGLCIGGLALAVVSVRAMIDAYHVRRVAWQRDKIAMQIEQMDIEREQINLENHRMRSKLVILRPDEWGRRGISWDGAIYRDLDSKSAFSQSVNLAILPVMEQLEKLLEGQRAMARQLPPTTYHVENIRGDQVLPEGAEPEALGPGGPTWGIYPIGDLLGAHAPSIEHLIVGARPTEGGGLDVVSKSLHELMHVLCVGASGWGKSTWLRAFLYQVARAPEPCEVVAIDTSGSALNGVKGWGKLRYPLARTHNDARAVLAQVAEEIDRRRGLWEQQRGVETLQEYNRATGAALPPWIVVADESTHLLRNTDISDPLCDVVTTARQYGIYGIVTGQTAKATVIDSVIRDQFSTRLCFHTSPPSSRVVIDDRGAAELAHKGRAICQFVGTDLMELQGPWVTKDEFMRALSNGGSKYAMPILEPTEEPEADKANGRGGVTPDQVREVLERHARGESDTAIAGALWHSNPYYLKRVRDILAENDNNKAENVQDAPEAGDPEAADFVVIAPDGVDFCDFCGRDGDSIPDGVTFAACEACGVAVCSDCMTGGLCPDCEEK